MNHSPASPDAPYVLGIDFGTLSGRCVLLDTRTGEEVASATHTYAHGVMDKTLPDGTPLAPHTALQHPEDYLDVLRTTIPAVLQKAAASPEAVAGIGWDFTACTVLPVDADGTPLCMIPAFAAEPHAYVKLWKHHAAQCEADCINALATLRHEPWLPRYGGRISSEWLLPKLLETLEKAPDVYTATYRYMEAADWLSLVLTGTETHSAAHAGYKALWDAETAHAPTYGYPTPDFLSALHPALTNAVGTVISPDVRTMDKNAGTLTASGATLCGLLPGTPVALPMIDAHAALPAIGIARPGEMAMILGTSTCHILHASEPKPVPGICGYVQDGVIPGLCTYEAGQPCTGDMLDHFVRNATPAAYTAEADARGISLHELLTERAARLSPGESGLVALDWFNGNRTPLQDADLSGLILGLTLDTTPEAIYRALIESTAYGTRLIFDTFRDSGIPITRITAAGGIARKNPLLMQIYADILGQDIAVAGTTQAAARGAAIYAAVAGGLYPDLPTAIEQLSVPDAITYHPNPAHAVIYDTLYHAYKTLHRHFGEGQIDIMKQLHALRGANYT